MSSIVELSRVEVTLLNAAGPVKILRGIDLNVAKGQAVGVVGPSGSGKSTLMMILAGLEAPTSGRVAVAGTELGALDEDRLARFRREHLGIVFQSFHLLPAMTALENVAVPLELRGRADAFDAARGALAAVGLEQRLGHYPSQLSGGEQQRVALARAVVGEPALLLADEPTGNLDGATGLEIIELLFALRAQAGATLVLITHDEALARRCDRILHLRDGQIEAETAGGGEARLHLVQ